MHFWGICPGAHIGSQGCSGAGRVWRRYAGLWHAGLWAWLAALSLAAAPEEPREC